MPGLKPKTEIKLRVNRLTDSQKLAVGGPLQCRRDGGTPRATNFVHKAICGFCIGMHDPQRFQDPESQISGSARLSDVDKTVTPDPMSVSVGRAHPWLSK
ncbi:uncharacterized protein BO87DRAFT_420709 [Aspergillus neoniger CBS 115656]|uniref:Uncharacterized protein n=1 Tax=Aspergillus neoniger (strain CBS 115656) TaxID=1448310 RepID=A0A318ZVI9_ASPNB|nr:hypothetical protein BO87DRAFT_420709 [Aspergillus neoniger CBS 115656]PYH39582.1 hypothetical protein BO87DRAFT_420709 [Aspergillus neoniger CBS 115656]